MPELRCIWCEHGDPLLNPVEHGVRWPSGDVVRPAIARDCTIGLARAREPHCHAGQDGDCIWAACPQEENNRANYQRWCPLAIDSGER